MNYIFDDSLQIWNTIHFDDTLLSQSEKNLLEKEEYKATITNIHTSSITIFVNNRFYVISKSKIKNFKAFWTDNSKIINLLNQNNISYQELKEKEGDLRLKQDKTIVDEDQVFYFPELMCYLVLWYNDFKFTYFEWTYQFTLLSWKKSFLEESILLQLILLIKKY